MIGRPELARLAFLNGIGERAQEKDYVLAWLLAARATLGPRTLTFKGGTALRRCYFSDYRHSEDLDFTADEPLSPVELAHAVDAWCSWLGSESGIEARRETGLEGDTTFYVAYIGPLQARDGRAVKIDVALDEAVREAPQVLPQLTEYSDLEGNSYNLEVYGLPEIWAEKLRSLMQRAEPRDLYDLDQLAARDRGLPSAAAAIFDRKTRAKGLDPADLTTRLEARERVLRRHWTGRLAHQVRELPDFESTWRRVNRSLRQGGLLS